MIILHILACIINGSIHKYKCYQMLFFSPLSNKKGVLVFRVLKTTEGLCWWRSGYPPANAGDTGSIPGLGKSYMPQSN